MSIQDILIRPARSLGGFRFDGVVMEQHVNRMEITSERVENGALVSDNAVVQPVELMITVLTTDTPVTFAPAFGQIVDTVTGFFGSSKESNLTRTQSAYEFLLSLMQAREPLSVETNLKTYNNMMLIAVPVTQDANTKGLLQSTLTLKQIEFVDTKLTLSSKATEGTVKTALETSQRGRISTEAPSDAENKSALKKFIDWAL